MNLLLDEFPTSIWIGGAEYRLNTDFRVSILFERSMQDARLSREEHVLVALGLYFDELPADTEAAIAAIMDFYRGGRPEPQTGGDSKNSHRIYSYEQDDRYIYAAFLEQYRIDLNTAGMHWWKFRALFDALSPDTLFSRIMGWRASEIDSKLPTSEKKRLRELKALYALERSETEIEKISTVETVLMGLAKN